MIYKKKDQTAKNVGIQRPRTRSKPTSTESKRPIPKPRLPWVCFAYH